MKSDSIWKICGIGRVGAKMRRRYPGSVVVAISDIAVAAIMMMTKAQVCNGGKKTNLGTFLKACPFPQVSAAASLKSFTTLASS